MSGALSKTACRLTTPFCRAKTRFVYIGAKTITPKKLKSLFGCSHKVCAESTDLAQITSYPSAMANSIVFVRLRTKTVICYTAHRRFISAMAMI